MLPEMVVRVVYDALFQPIQLGTATIKNRIVREAHGTGLPWVDSSDELVFYHAERAKHGAGLLFLERAGVHPSSAELDWAFYDPAIIPGCRRLAEAMHAHGAKMFVQVCHRGSSFPGPQSPAWSASAIPNPVAGEVPVEMTKAMIDDVVAGFVQACLNTQAGGLDGVEIQAGHGYLIAQFLSPATNRRTDEYGGSLQGRTRFLLEVIDAVRTAVGTDFPLGIRISGADDIEGGQDAAQTSDIVSLVEDRVDFVSVSLGSYYRYHRLIPTMEEPMAFEMPTTEPVTRGRSVPTIFSGRVMTLDAADHVVRSGVADMVSVVRGLIADPELVTKSRERRESEVRPCIGTSQGCVGRPRGRIACVVNPSVGREHHRPSRPEPAEVRRHIFVVGGGPAGLEAARMAAIRGHTVELHEMRGELGGQVAIAANAPRRSDFGAITKWQADELNRLGVKVRTKSAVDDDLVLASGADAVVIATGALPRTDGFQASRPLQPIIGIRQTRVISPWEVLGAWSHRSFGRHAVVFDDTGRYDALSVAEALIEAGSAVTLISAHDALGAKLPFPLATAGAARERLVAAGLTFMPHAFLERIDEGCVVGGHAFTENRFKVEADTVVIVGHKEPERGLADVLQGRNLELHIIGDASGRCSLLDAIADGDAVGRLL